MDINSSPSTSRSPQALELQKNILNEVELLRAALKTMGTKVRPETERSLSRLSSMETEALEKTLADVRNFRELCQDSVEPEGPTSNDRQLLWNTLRKLKAVPPSDIIDKIGDGDVIEIYNTEFIQVFRNLNYIRHFKLLAGRGLHPSVGRTL